MEYKITLLRTSFLEKETLGVLMFEGKPLLVTLELPWRENSLGKSCIPDGDYDICPFMSKKFGSVYKVYDVPDRNGILFHVGNSYNDTRGCILVGMSFRLNEKGGVDVIQSRAALNLMKSMLDKKPEIKLQVRTHKDYGK
jgi:hypothetical protein